jgi:hypothetical protein
VTLRAIRRDIADLKAGLPGAAAPKAAKVTKPAKRKTT